MRNRKLGKMRMLVKMRLRKLITTILCLLYVSRVFLEAGNEKWKLEMKIKYPRNANFKGMQIRYQESFQIT